MAISMWVVRTKVFLRVVRTTEAMYLLRLVGASRETVFVEGAMILVYVWVIVIL